MLSRIYDNLSNHSLLSGGLQFPQHFQLRFVTLWLLNIWYEAGREGSWDKWFKDRGILMLSQFPCALWPIQGHRIPEYSWGPGTRIPPSHRWIPHPWILKVPFSWTSVSTDSESADTDSQLYLFLKSVFLMILEGHELFIPMEGLFSFSSSEFIGIHGEWQL